MDDRTARCVLLAAFVLLAAPSQGPAQSRDPLREARLQMVRDFIESEGVRNPRVLAAMRTVPRHEFVRISQRRQAYQDAALPIGYGQTISPPFIVAYMTETIDPQPDDRVLEIGTGSGYQAAVLSGLVKEVYTIEIVKELGESAAARLKRLGYANVHVKVGDGYQGWPEHAPFDKIIVTCSPEDVPEPLFQQLQDGGKMIIPLGQRYQQVFYLFEKRGGKLQQTRLIPTLFVPMTGISEELRKVKPDPLRPQIVNGDFERDEEGDGLPDHWHYRRQAQLVEGGAPQGQRYLQFENTDRGRLSQVLQGLAVDGREIAALEIGVNVKFDRAAAGADVSEQPALVIHFYDSHRRPIGEGLVGPWQGTADWQRLSRRIAVPSAAREAILRIGLNGGTGRLAVDDVTIAAERR